MTAIMLNLLAEEQQAQQASARDPVKTTVAIAAVLLSCTFLAGTVLSVLAGQKRSEAQGWQTSLEKLTQTQQKNPGSDFPTVSAAAEALLAINRARQLCAPQLALVKDLMPESINPTRLSFTMITQAREPDAAQMAQAFDSEKSGAPKVRHPAAAKNIDRLVLLIEGKATSARPEIEVDQYIQSLRADKAVSGQVQQIQLRSIARAAAPADAGKAAAMPSAVFVIECQYKERK